jgi:hypothetical protein
VPVQGHWRIEAPRNRCGRGTFRLKLGHKAARGFGLSGSAAAIFSHSQERRDLFVLGHALSLGGRAAEPKGRSDRGLWVHCSACRRTAAKSGVCSLSRYRNFIIKRKNRK